MPTFLADVVFMVAVLPCFSQATDGTNRFEGSQRLWQPVILGLIGGLFFGTAIWLGYSVLSYLLD